MTCAELRDAIHAVVDGESSEAELQAVNEHLRTCAGCTRRLVVLRALKHGVSRLAARCDASAALEARIVRTSKPTRLWRSAGLRWAALSVAGSLVAMGLIIGLVARRPNTESFEQALVTDHVKYASLAQPEQVASDQPSEVRRYFASQLPFSPVVPTLAGARLRGGRLCTVRGHVTQLLFYEREGRTLSLYVARKPHPLEKCRTESGHHVCGRRVGSVALYLVGDAPPEQLEAMLQGLSL